MTVFTRLLFLIVLLSGPILYTQPCQGQQSAAQAETHLSEEQLDAARFLVVLDEARLKPLDTFARSLMRLMTSRESWRPRKAPHPWLTRDPVTNFFSLLYQPEEWKDLPVIHINSAVVKESLGLDPKEEWISYNELRGNQNFMTAFAAVMQRQREGATLTSDERKFGDLHGLLNVMDGVFFGGTPKLVPITQLSGDVEWVSLREGMEQEKGTTTADLLRQIGDAFLTGDGKAFASSCSALQQEFRSRVGATYPSDQVLAKEVTYNSYKPFRKSWIYMLAGVLMFATAMGVRNGLVYLLAWLMSLLGFSLATYGLYLRIVIAGRPPVSNMYESVVYMGWGILFFALIFEAIYRKRLFGLCGGAMAVITLILADMLPFDPKISPLVPVLRSNYWLIMHVLTIVISYSAFALAMGLAHLALLLYLFVPGKAETIRLANLFVYRAMQIGVLLLAIGTILGGVWANESWGRFWGWDPKETWALISLFGYLALLHAKSLKIIGPFGLNVGAILGFQLILMTWYGVNYVLGTGLHSYGFGSGGGGYVAGYLAAEVVFMVIVALRFRISGLVSDPEELQQDLGETDLEDSDPVQTPTG